MNLKKVTPRFYVSEQINPRDIGLAAAQGIKTIICNRPDHEQAGQPDAKSIADAAADLGIDFINMPVPSGSISEDNVAVFAKAYKSVKGPILAYCRSGMRCTALWALAEAELLDVNTIMATAMDAGYDLKGLRPRLEARAGALRGADAAPVTQDSHDVVIVGGGAGGIATAASLLKRDSSLDILIIEPRDTHYYQPGFTMVGGGVFEPEQTERSMASVMPKAVKWKKAAVADFEPQKNCVVLEDGTRVAYRVLVAAPGLKLDWDAVDGLMDSLGKNGVTSNYLYEMAPYTWSLVEGVESGRAVFTQPPMPIKSAGAPQKAMYLSCDHWFRRTRLNVIDVDFRNSGPVLFGVPEYVPPLMKYVEKYNINLCFSENLVAVDGPAQKAWFDRTAEDGETTRVEVDFDMLHVCPPQTAPDFIKDGPLANEAGWIDVSQDTLQHTKFGNVFAVGDAHSAPNAKTAAAVRNQAPVVAENVISTLSGSDPHRKYDGYGSCPLIVERGKIVLAEFGYGGKHLPTFPQWIINSYEPSRLAWILKRNLLPPVYWDFLLKGREWLITPME